MPPPQHKSAREINIETLVHATKLTVGKHENLEHYLKRLTHLTLNGDAKRGVFRKIENLHPCPNLKVLYLYDNDIRVIENLEIAPQLSHLHLQNNQIERIENLDALPQLEKVYLEGNRIARLEGLQSCYYIQELHLSNQTLPAATVFSFESQTLQVLSRSLRILNLSSCHVSSAAPLAMLRSLEQLDLSKNEISELEDVFALLSSLTALAELDLRANPVSNTPKYREKAITFSSSRLALLDKKDVDANQRRMMQSHLAHKYRKRQEAAPERLSSSGDAGAGGANNAMSETRRMMKHGSTVHQLRSMQISSPGMAKNAKVQCERDGLGVAGASCSAIIVSRSTPSSSSSNNKHH